MHRWYPLALLVVLPLAGCANETPEPKKPATRVSAQPAHKHENGKKAEKEAGEIRQSLAKLSPEDRKLAQEQKYCALETDNLLGSMGAPVKVMVKDKPVFLCCKGCKEDALQDADKTLAKVDELKKKVADEASK